MNDIRPFHEGDDRPSYAGENDDTPPGVNYTGIKSEANSTGAMIFGLTVAICAALAVIMLTIKLGLVLFGA